jgi:hypothetical protein
MTDSEAKARQKLAEAEKKGKKSGGLFSFLGGGGGSNEATDLYVQDNAINCPSSSKEPVVCPVKNCLMEFDELHFFEEHYAQRHSFECATCRSPFPNYHTLEIHSDEEHSAFFRSVAEKAPNDCHFRCFVANCAIRYPTKEERNEHCRVVHLIEDPRVQLNRRKLPQHNATLAEPLSAMQSITFGDNQERSFVQPRKIAAAKRTFYPK